MAGPVAHDAAADGTASPGPVPPSRPGAGRRAAGVAAALGVLVLALLGGAAGTAAWALRTAGGSAWLLAHLPGVEVEAPRGPLLGDFGAARVVVRLPGAGGRLALRGLAWQGLAWGRAAAPLWGRVRIASLSVERVDLALAAAPAKAGPPQAPTDLGLPVEVEVADLRIGELHAAALGDSPFRGLSSRLHLGANGGAEHRIERLAFGWQQLQLRADARLGTRAPLQLQATLGAAQAAAPSSAVAGAGAALPAWRAGATLRGPLATLAVQATLRAEPGAQRPPQSVDLRATLHPFAAWPLGDLQASAQELDLSAFVAAAPATALALQATASSTAADRPARLAVSVRNASPGGWNEARLPVRELALDLAVRPDQPDRIELRRIDALLGNAQAAAGHLRGTGAWGPDGWRLAATLDAVRPALLDARAPPMTLNGPVDAHGSASGGAGAAAVDLSLALAGTLDDRGRSRALQVRLAGSLAGPRIDVRELQASAGGARATASGTLTQGVAAGEPWRVRAEARLADLDPGTWLPADAAAAWRRAPTRLNLQASVDLALPAPAGPGAPVRPAAWLGALRGRADATLAPSLLAGAPVSGQAHWRNAGGAPATVGLDLDAAGNRVHGDGRLDLAGSGSTDDWSVAVDAPALARLAPAFRLFLPAAGHAALGGTLDARARVTGRWPAVSTTGRIAAEGVLAGPLTLQHAAATWTLASAANAPAEARITLAGAALAQDGAPGPRLEQLQLALDGTGRAHALTVRAEVAGRPPAWTETLQPGSAGGPGAHTLAVLEAHGGLVDAGGVALAGWRGRIDRVDLRSDAAASAPLLHAADLGAEWLWDGGPQRAGLEPGRLELLGGAIRWRQLAWQAGSAGAPARIDADADLEPLRIAPLLARAQPEFGWNGDLAVAGHLRVHSAPTFSADVVVERRGGDLSITDEAGTRALGLTDLRLGLAADHGTWNFTQGLAGSAVGVLAGAEVVHTAPQLAWPAADAPLQGVLEVRVDDLGAWGGWVPPGWRLGGALQTHASFGGRFGAPEYTGTVTASKLAVRNFLQGVNVTDGDLAVRLQGTSARIERFVAHAGDGTLSLQGSAEFGTAPRAVLQVTADKFQLLGRVDRRIVASGTGQLRLDSRSVAFDGRFGVDEGLIDFTRSDAPSLSDDVVVSRAADQPSPAAVAAAAARPAPGALPAAAPQRQVALDLNVNLGQDLKVRGHGLDAKLRGDLRITSPGGALAVNGTVRAEDGTYAAYGQKLAINRGLVTFSGAVDNPRLDIEATRPDIDTRVGVIISGTPANLRVRLFSDPEMSEIDKLSWLVMGHASDSLGRGDTALLQRAALALLSGEGGGPTDQITKALGLDDISLSQQTNGEVTQTVLALGKQISKRWYVGYERGLNATTGSFQLIYRVAQRLTLRLQGGEDNAADVIWTWRWR